MDLTSLYAQALTLSLPLSWWHQLGLAFLLGSFTVATLSDLKYMAAQREFLEVWLLFTLAIFVLEALEVGRGHLTTLAFAIKWGLVVLLSALAWGKVGVLFRLALGDVAALAATASLLTPLLVLIFYLLAKVLSLGLGPLLARGRRHWPFMPVVSLATLGILFIAWLF